MVVTLNPALGSVRANVAFGNSNKAPNQLQVLKSSAETEIKHSNKIIDGIAHFGRKAALGTMLTLSSIATLFTGCEPVEDPPTPIKKPTQEVFMDYMNKMYGTGTGTNLKSTAGTTALIDSLAYSGGGTTYAFKYDYATPDTVKAKTYFMQNDVLYAKGTQKTWQEAGGKIVSSGIVGNNPASIAEYTKDVDGLVLKNIGGSKSKYLSPRADTAILLDLNTGAKTYLKVLTRVFK